MESIDDLDVSVGKNEDEIEDLKITTDDNMMGIEINTDMILSNRMIINLNSEAIANPLVTSSILSSITTDIASNKRLISTNMISIN